MPEKAHTSSYLTHAVGLALCLAALGCSGGEGQDKPDPSNVQIEIGLSQDQSEGFRSAQDGDLVELARGAQGGFHVWTAPRILGAEGTVHLERSARRVVDGTLVLRASTLVFDIPSMEGAWWYPEQAIPSFMCPTPIGVQSFDTEIEFFFSLYTEDDELLAEDSLVLAPTCPEDSMEFCLEVCSG